MVSIEEYRANPCKVSSIPYWKMKSIEIPKDIVVIHHGEYMAKPGPFSKDILYFRLKHDLRYVEQVHLPEIFAYRYVDANCISDLEEVTRIINKCYADIKVSLDQVRKWTRTAVYCSDLWVFIIDISKQRPVALGIAELDRDVPEGALEWIQVLPQYRGRRLGPALVSTLLGNLKGRADFVTVSGRVDNETKPEKLYRRYGFTGNDIWHVLLKK